MDIEKLYQYVVLRDILEYITPGGIIILGGALVGEAILVGLGVNFSIFAGYIAPSLWKILLTIIFAYSVGHLLCSLDHLFGREKESRQASEILSADTWLKNNLIKVVSEYTNIPPAEIEKAIDDPKMSTTIREIGRSIIYSQQQDLYNDFVGRHSIFSRYSKNMSYALSFLLISMIISAAISFKKIVPIVLANPIFFGISAIVVSALFIIAIQLYASRAVRIRKVMIKHTYQIWYVDYILSKRSKSDKRVIDIKTPVDLQV